MTTSKDEHIINHHDIGDLFLREVVPTECGEEVPKKKGISPFRFQIGRTVNHESQHPVYGGDGRLIRWQTVTEPFFEIKAFGPTPEAAVSHLRTLRSEK